MIEPVKQSQYRLTQGFGGNKATYQRFGLQGHNGFDYATPDNTDIYAPHSGKVMEVAYDPSGYGLYIKIENEKEGSVLAHLKENHVAIGAQVMEGQLIAKSNNSGFSTGPHLHWGYYRTPRDRNNGYLGFIDPTPYINKPQPPSTPQQDVALLKKRIEDLEATEIRLRREKDNAISGLEDKLKIEQSKLANIRPVLLKEFQDKAIVKLKEIS